MPTKVMNHITAAELRQKIQAGETLFLVDVREIGEHREFNLGGLHIPLPEIIHHSDQIPRNRKVIVYCHRGIRSQLAIQRLEEKFGYTNLVNLKGGTAAWLGKD